jgi:Effector Associated Constant Component 1
MSEQVVRLHIAPGSERFDTDDERWRSQANDLYTELRREVDGVERQSTAVPGSKGTIESVILALGSANAFGAAVLCFKAWLQRDRTRFLEIIWTNEHGDEEKVVLRGDAIDTRPLQEIAAGAARRIGGEAWLTPTTEPS